jgi:protoheme IX farnesyltransferase
MVGASNAYNQVIEKDLDALMDRTKNRPVASGRMSSQPRFVCSKLAHNYWFNIIVFYQSKVSNVWCNFNIFYTRVFIRH